MCSLSAAFLTICVALAATAPARGADKYSMKDLQALQASESWDELMAHGLDIAPSERDKSWQETIEKAAVARLSGLKDDELKFLAAVKGRIEGDQKTFPFLQKSAPYKRAANQVTVKTFAQCYVSRDCKNGNDSDWLQIVLAHVNESPDDAANACNAGIMVSSIMVEHTALSMFAVAAKSGAAAPCCREASLKAAVAAGRKRTGYTDLAEKVGRLCKIK